MSEPTAKRAADAQAEKAGGTKELIEQILVAFILAFIFRCFVVEAFVIPTGSMAPTLLGAHFAFRCPDCGWRWTVNFSSRGGDDAAPLRANEVVSVRCPNCGYKLPRNLPDDPENDATLPRVSFGDRILVQKYIYLLRPPAAWDVVVFKSPSENSISPEGVEPYTQNFIKRLIGLPGETIMVLDGDIYVARTDKPTEALRASDFEVKRKPREAQEALWRIVYDADHAPRGLPRVYAKAVADASQRNGSPPETVLEHAEDPWRDPWLSRSTNWRGDGRGYAFDGAGVGALRFDPGVASEKHALTDWLAYDVTHAIGKQAKGITDSFNAVGYETVNRGDPLNNVSDLKLSATVQRTSGSPSVRLNLTKLGVRFTAEIGDSSVRLLKTPADSDQSVELASAPIARGDGRHRVEFANVDYRVSLRIDDREVLATTPEQYSPDVAALLREFAAKRPAEPPSVWIEASDGGCAISHLSLWRDVYYLNRDWGPNNYVWAMPDDFPTGSSYGKLMRLGPDEYFVMGDNSMLSADARVWTAPIQLPDDRLDVEAGRVPGRFMLGRAFFVYWPAGYTLLDGLPPLLPNFGQMRVIH